MSELHIVSAKSLPWLCGLDVIESMAPEWRSNLGPESDVRAAYAKYFQKTLYLDEVTTERVDLIRVEPGYGDVTACYHNTVEEAFYLRGDSHIFTEGHFRAGYYFWRPPGWVHQADTQDGFEALLMLTGDNDLEHSGPASRMVTDTSQLGTHPMRRNPQMPHGPRGWVRCLDSALLPTQPGQLYGRSHGPLPGFDLDRLGVKVLSRNVRTEAHSALMSFGAGYAQSGAGRYGARLHLYVLEGQLDLDGTPLPTGTFASVPAGVTTPPLSSPDGAVAFVKSAGALQRV